MNLSTQVGCLCRQRTCSSYCESTNTLQAIPTSQLALTLLWLTFHMAFLSLSLQQVMEPSVPQCSVPLLGPIL